MPSIPSDLEKALPGSASSVPVIFPRARSLQRSSTEMVMKETGRPCSALLAAARLSLCVFQVSHQKAQKVNTVTVPGCQRKDDPSDCGRMKGCILPPGSDRATAGRTATRAARAASTGKVRPRFMLSLHLDLQDARSPAHRGSPQRLGQAGEGEHASV